MRRRVPRCLTRLQTIYNVLKYHKKWLNTTKFQLTGTAPEPEIIQFNNAHSERGENDVKPGIDAEFLALAHSVRGTVNMITLERKMPENCFEIF